jgi:hypothetical protein
MANINNIVNVQISINTGGLNPRDFGINLSITPDDTLPASDSLRLYQSLDAVGDDFSTTSEPYISAEVYFAQSLPPKAYMIGRWFKTASKAILQGGGAPADVSTFTAISDGSFKIKTIDVTGIDFTTDANYSDIANTITNALFGAGVLATTCIFVPTLNAFEISSDATGATETLTFASPTGGGTDISELAKLSETSATSLSQGQDAETIVQAFDRFRSINNIFYFVTTDVSERDQPTIVELSQHIQALGSSAPYFLFTDSADPQALVTDDATSVPALLFAAQSPRTTCDWQTATETTEGLYNKYLAVSSAAFMSGATDFNRISGIPNANLSDRPLIQPTTTLTDTQTQELNRKRVNRFTPVGGGTVSQNVANIYQEGFVVKDGFWQDLVYATDWLQNYIQVNVFDYAQGLSLLGSKIPQTVDGQAQVINVIKNSLDQAITNGFLAPGQLSPVVRQDFINVTQNSDFSGFLPHGYSVYGAPFNTLTESQRAERKMPVFYFWAKTAGAANSFTIVGVIDE